MENYQLRTTILEVVDRLSDINRERLHFILANHVPRRIRDNSSTSGTLHLMESLFDQDKLSEQNFTILIDAFKAIKCAEGLKILREHKRRVYENLLNQRISAGISLNEQIIRDQEEEEDDKSPTQSFLGQISNCDDNTKIIKDNLNTNMNSVAIDVGTKSSFSEDDQPFYLSFRMNKCIFIIIGLLLLLVLAITMTFLITRFNKKDCTLDSLKEHKGLKLTIQELTRQLSEKDKEKILFEKEQENVPIKAGRIFGNASGNYFDDSFSSEFQLRTYYENPRSSEIKLGPYLNKMYVHKDDQGFETYRFSYYFPKRSEILSPFHGNEQFSQEWEFDFDRDGIKKVEGHIIDKTFQSQNGTFYTKPVITAIRFTSFKDVPSPIYNQSSGISFTESFQGYRLGYVTGRSNEYIEQIQFIWYRN